MASVFAWRGLLALTSFVSSVVAARLLVDDLGVSGYAALSIVLTLPTLLPFADLGLGSAVVNASGDVQARRQVGRARRQVSAAARLLGGVGFLIAAAAFVIYSAGLWENLLGPAIREVSNLDRAASAVLCLFALNLALGLGSRVLQGTGRNSLMSATSIVGPPTNLLFVWLFSNSSLPTAYAATSSILATVTVAITHLMLATRRDPLLLRSILTAKPVIADYRYVVSLGLAGLGVAAMTAVLLTSDRVMLSFIDRNALTSIALALPLYAAGYGALNSTGVTLWPRYRDSLSSGRLDLRTLVHHALLLGVAGLVCGVGLLSLGPVVVRIMTDGTARVDLTVFAGFALLLVVQSSCMPFLMVLTDRRGFAQLTGAYSLAVAVKIIILLPAVPLLGAYSVPLATTTAYLLVIFPMAFGLSRSRLSKQSVIREPETFT